MRDRGSFRPWYAHFASVTLIASLLTGVASDFATGSTPGASIKVSVPASVKSGSTFTVTASGFSGNYVGVKIVARLSPCIVSVASFSLKGVDFSVPKNKAFTQSQKFIAKNPGQHHACVYLYRPGLFTKFGPSLHAFETYTVT
jgi:hypothetical protein